MNLLNETYLIQIKNISDAQTVELRVRYLGSETRASNISYYIDVICGNFGFTSKNNGSGFEAITSKNGIIYIDTQAIKVTSGKSLLDTLVAWIHIENELSQYTHKSLRRKQYDSKTLESKARESFKRLSSYRTSMRKKSIDGLETVQTINKIIEEKRKISVIETPDICEKFVNEIVEDIFRDAMDEIEFKEYVVVDDRFRAPTTINESHIHNGERNNRPEESCASRSEHNEKHSVRRTNTEIIEYRSQDDFMNSFRKRMASFFSSSCNNIAQYEQTVVLNSNQNLTIEIDIPCFQEDVVSSVEVATHQIADTEYIEENDRYSMGDPEDLRSCEWLLNGQETEKEKGNDSSHAYKISEAEEMYWNNINRIRCQNCNIIMIPPIFMCSEGHSMCLTCKTLNCGICGIEVTDIRNIDLEDISKTISHPCRFAGKGCGEVHSCYEIRKHEVYCDYFKYRCPAGCMVIEKYFSIKAHIRLLHPSLKIVEDTHYPFPRGSEFVFANKYGIFYCTAPLKVNSIEWTVSFCGIEKISFVCRVKVTGKKGEKVYTLQRHENGFKSIIFLDELKSLRLKDKHAVLYLSDY
ncbi:hypothetical protein Trydic_g21425 [Trypoxylus dichotomus]